MFNDRWSGKCIQDLVNDKITVRISFEFEQQTPNFNINLTFNLTLKTIIIRLKVSDNFT